MEIDISDEGLYEAYSQEIIDHLWYVFRITPQESEAMLLWANFREHFFKHVDNYEFTEPSEIAEELLEKYQDRGLK